MGEARRHSQPREIAHLRAPIVLAHEQPFHIGDAEFHPATRKVRFRGQASVVEPRVMQLLIALHRAGGPVVNKDDLLRSCWEGRTVGDDAINHVVSQLRGVAESDLDQQFRIETITKVGYRLRSSRHCLRYLKGSRPGRSLVCWRLWGPPTKLCKLQLKNRGPSGVRACVAS